MATNEQKDENVLEEEEFTLDSEFSNEDNELYNKNRIAVRYIREDITLTLKPDGFFKWGKPPQVRLRDISSKGVFVSCRTELKLKKKYILTFRFKDGKQFQTHGMVVNHPENSLYYGIKFDTFEHELGDYLVVTQKDLNLKK